MLTRWCLNVACLVMMMETATLEADYDKLLEPAEKPNTECIYGSFLLNTYSSACLHLCSQCPLERGSIAAALVSLLTEASMGESGLCSFPIQSTTLFITNVLKKINYFICPNRRYTFISSERRELALFLFSSYFQFIGHYFEHKI